MATQLEELLKMLDGSSPPIKQEQTYITDTPMELKPEILADEKGFITSKPANYFKSVAEPALQSQLGDVEDADKLRSTYLKKLADSQKNVEDSSQRILEAKAAPIVPDEFKNSLLRSLMPDSAKREQEAKLKEYKDFNEALITGFMPVLLGSQLGFGGSAGANAAAKTSETAIDSFNKKKLKEAESKARNDNQSDLLKTILSDQRGAQKEAVEQASKAATIAATLYGKDSDIAKTAQAQYDNLTKELTKNTIDSAKNTADFQQKEDAAKLASEDKAKAEKEKNKRTKIMAGSKPPSEGERKAAEFYAGMQKAEDAFQRLRKDHPIVPSRTKQFFDLQKSTFENADGNTLMGEMLKKVPDGPLRRQIQIELDFLARKLRKESGAAISVGEYVAEGNINFPRMGDDEKTIQEKDATRLQTLSGSKLSAGRAPIAPIQQPKYATQPQAPKFDLKSMSREEKIKKLKELQGGK